jgi:hypothetical protein
MLIQYEEDRMKTWPIATAARAADISPLQVSTWIVTGILPLDSGDKRSTGRGDRSGLSRERVIQVAIAKQIMLLGIPSSHAVRFASRFTGEGNAGRPRGQLFPHGRTMIFIGVDGATVKNVRISDTLTDVIEGSARCIILDLNQIVAHCDAELNKVKH